MKPVKRNYESAHRRVLAEQTRAQIQQSARSLFSERGYVGTTIAQIANAAGVSEPTVYATFGGKRAILLSLLDEMEKAADASELAEFLDSPGSNSRAQLRAFVEFSVRLFTKGADLIRVAEAAGVGDPDVAALWQLGDTRRYAACEKVVATIVRRKELRQGLDRAKAADILWALCGPEAYTLFVVRRKWLAHEFGDWIYDVLLEQLVQPSA